MSFKTKCPQCHKRLTKELEDKEFMGHETVEVPGEPVALKGETRLSTWEPYFARKDISYYKYSLKCPNCGHEWVEMKTKERGA
ncbi:MAG: hypothetical protein ACLQEQ_08530 [Nitrososphaerales archaeon]